MKRRKGFTLIEMMIVVAIIALLATIAIPNYVSFQLRAKTSEAKASLGAIRTCEEAYKAENDTYLDCVLNPTVMPSGGKGAWLSTPAGWDDLGFEPKGDVYYQYQVTGSTAAVFTAQAQSDLDGAGTPFSTFTMDQDGVLTSANPLK